MCGIICVKRLDGKPAQKQVLKRYKKQKHRGQDGFGYVTIAPNLKVEKFSRFQTEKKMREKLELQAADTVLFHHRYPTSTPNVPESAHPLLISHKELSHDYYVVHNGVISNDESLRDKHTLLGYDYTTDIQNKFVTRKGHEFVSDMVWNDSEAFAIELVRNIERKTAFTGATGSIAYIALKVEKASKKSVGIYYGTNGYNPLTITRDKNQICIASEGGQRIPDSTCHYMNFQTNEIQIIEHVKMISNYEPKKIGFDMLPGTPTTQYSPTASYYDAKSMSQDELEDEIEFMRNHIAELEGDTAIARSTGDKFELEEVERSKKYALEKLRKLESAYDQSIFPF